MIVPIEELIDADSADVPAVPLTRATEPTFTLPLVLYTISGNDSVPFIIMFPTIPNEELIDEVTSEDAGFVVT